MVAADIGRGYRSQLRLDDLPDFLLERHARHEVGDEGFDGRVESGRYRARPARRIAVAARHRRCRHEDRKRDDHGDRQHTGEPGLRDSALEVLQRRRQARFGLVHARIPCWSAAQTRCDQTLMVPLSDGAVTVRNTRTLNDRDSGRMTALVRWRPVRGRSISPVRANRIARRSRRSPRGGASDPASQRSADETLLNCCADASAAGLLRTDTHR